MVQRHSVSLPDELDERMRKYKNRINVSKVFQEAMEERIRQEEEFDRKMEEDKELCRVVERLKKEEDVKKYVKEYLE